MIKALGRLRIFKEPAIINAAQVLVNLIAVAAGIIAVTGGFPHLLTGTIGPVMAVAVGCILAVGGSVGAVACLRGVWWVERIALLITGLGWFLMVPAAIAFAVNQDAGPGDGWSGRYWLILMLLLTTLCDVVKRYQRIAWAYLDPTR